MHGGIVMKAFRWIRQLAACAAATVLVLTPAAAAHATGPIEFRSEMNHKCLEIYAFNANNKAKVVTWDCWGGANQKWYWDGEFIRNTMNHKCLEIYAFNGGNGADVVMWDCWGGANQKWYRNGNEIRSRLNNKCLEIYAFDGANGAKVVTWDCWGGANQKWY
jgi:hypothetical protein